MGDYARTVPLTETGTPLDRHKLREVDVGRRSWYDMRLVNWLANEFPMCSCPLVTGGEESALPGKLWGSTGCAILWQMT